MTSAKQVIAEAKKELAGGGFTPDYAPTWHPYYWLGRQRAAEDILRGIRRGNKKPRADRKAR